MVFLSNACILCSDTSHWPHCCQVPASRFSSKTMLCDGKKKMYGPKKLLKSVFCITVCGLAMCTYVLLLLDFSKINDWCPFKSTQCIFCNFLLNYKQLKDIATYFPPNVILPTIELSAELTSWLLQSRIITL